MENSHGVHRDGVEMGGHSGGSFDQTVRPYLTEYDFMQPEEMPGRWLGWQSLGDSSSGGYPQPLAVIYHPDLTQPVFQFHCIQEFPYEVFDFFYHKFPFPITSTRSLSCR